MPIRPQNRFFYPIDWPQLSEAIRFGRAKGCCEQCGRPHGQLVFHLGDGRWWDAEVQTWRSGWGRALKLAPLECLPAAQACRPPASTWRVRIWTMTRATTTRRTSRRSVSAVISCTTGPSTCASAGSPTATGRL